MLTEECPFFLTPGSNQHKCWYKKSPMGINKLYGIMNEMKEGAGIQNPRITPYSSRKRLVQTLQDEGVPANQIVQISGHKNVNSINNYSRINIEQAKGISSILSNKKSTDLQPVQRQLQPTPYDSGSAPTNTGFPHSVFPNCHFHGPVTLNFSSSVSETQTLSQMPTINVSRSERPCATITRPVSLENSPVARRPFKRIRVISDSGSD